MHSPKSVIFFHLILCIAAISFSEPTKLELISKWKVGLTNDPKITKLECIDSITYNIETQYFNYKGKLKIFDIKIDKSPYDTNFPFRGRVLVELPELSQDSIRKYQTSSITWNELNSYFTYSNKQGKWLNNEEYQESSYSTLFQDTQIPLYKKIFDQYGMFIVSLIFVLLFFNYLNGILNQLKMNTLYLKQLTELLKNDMNEKKQDGK